MQQETHSIPKRRSSAGIRMETRPIYIEEWLDSLPYIDFNKTSRLLLEATTETNKETIKPDDRLELVKLYNRPYHYYLESQIKAGSQHTLQSMENMQDQITILKKIALNLAHACRLSLDEGQHRKTVWRQKKSPLPSVLMAMNYLSHSLIFSYLEYTPPPAHVWHELNSLYYFTENIGQQKATVMPLGGDPRKDTTSISNAYKRILLASMVDPYNLSFGSIWEIFIQLNSWNEHAGIEPVTRITNAGGYFVIDLEQDSGPVPYSKFDPDSARESHRLIDTRALVQLVKNHEKQLNAGKPLDESVHLSEFYAKSILHHMAKAWDLQPVRYSPRDKSIGKVQITCGINAIYYYLNGRKEFEMHNNRADENILSDVGDYKESVVTPKRVNYALEEWEIVDQGPGGFAISNPGKPNNQIKVGDLIGIIRDPGEAKAGGNLALGIIRWLIISRNKVYRIGLETIAADMLPAAIRTTSGSVMETTFNRAIIAGDFSPAGDNVIVTSAGMYKKDREYEFNISGKQLKARSLSLVESTINFDYFILSAG